MQCPFCKDDNDRVVDSRVISEGRIIRRRRKCQACDRRFTTYERIEASPRIVVKKDMRREFFNRDKILRGVRIACQKRDISEEQLEELVGNVEAEIFERYDNEVSAQVVGEAVSHQLRTLDQVAFVRFASVYREFTDVQQFYQEVAPLLTSADREVAEMNRAKKEARDHRGNENRLGGEARSPDAGRLGGLSADSAAGASSSGSPWS